MFKKTISLLLIFSLVISICVVSHTTAYANSEEKTTTTFTKETSKVQQEYVIYRDSLIDKYGVAKAYEMLNAELVDVKKTKLTSDMKIISDGGISTSGLFIYDSYNCYDHYSTNSIVANIKISAYKRSTSNTLDIVYEVDYNDPSFVAGIAYFDDMILASFDNNDLSRTAISTTSSLNNISESEHDVFGYITDHSTYARIIYTTIPRSGFTLNTAHSSAVLNFYDKFKDTPENVSISVGYSSIGISFGSFTYYDLNNLVISW